MRKLGGWLCLAAGMLAGSGAEAASCRIGALAEFPVTMRGRAATTMLQVDGKPARFEIDSGAWWSVISQASTVDLGLRPVEAPSYLQVSGIGGQAKTSQVSVRLGIGETSVPNVTFLVVPNEMGNAGLIGQNVLGIADVEYDLAGGVVRLMKAQDCDRANLAYWAGDKPFAVMPIEHRTAMDSHTNGVVLVNGVRLDATFDTGASTTLISLGAARRAHIDVHGAGAVDGGLTYGIGPKPVHTWIVPVAELAMGNEAVKNIHIRVADESTVEMLVGVDFFLSHRVYVANSQNKLFFTYNGGPIFDVGVIPKGADTAMNAPAANAAEPADAEAFYRRAMLRRTEQDYPGALADLDRAVAAAPANAAYLRDRAGVRLRLKNVDGARADLDAAIKLQPDDADTLEARAAMALGAHDEAAARADLEAAAKAATPAAAIRLAIAELDTEVGAYDAAIAQATQWLKTHPGDIAAPVALNSRCWARAVGNRELDQAISDCNAALRSRPQDVNVLDSRALAEFRAGKLTAALADYDAVLKADPNMAWSLYCRGMVKRAAGDKVGGEADIAAALKAQPKVAERAKRYGLS